MGKATVVGGKVGMTIPVNFDPVFANNKWEQIIEACQKNKVPDTWMVGDSKTMNIGGKEYAIDIIGKNHDTYSAGGTAPLTFQLHDTYADAKYFHSGYAYSSWDICPLRNTDLPAILALMPSEVQAGIKEVEKLHGKGSVHTISDKLFLLAEIEVFGTCTYSYSGEGTQYDYYKAGNSKIKTGAKYMDSAVNYWWTRSMDKTANDCFCVISQEGKPIRLGTSGNCAGVSFAFCF